MKNARISRLWIVALSLGLLLTHYGFGASSSEAITPANDSPFGGLTPNWDKKLPSDSRFTILSDFNNEAVRDNETGLVWVRSPSAPGFIRWSEAFNYCTQLTVASRKGWHVPMIEQLASLFSRTGGGLPAGHPFNTSSLANFWSATTVAYTPYAAWTVSLDGSSSATPKTLSGGSAWCVRGGQAFDGSIREYAAN